LAIGLDAVRWIEKAMSNPSENPLSEHAARVAALSTMPDAELVREMREEARVEKSDGLAWREFQRRYGEAVLRYIASHMHGAPREEREDVYSETVAERMVGGIEQFQPQAGATLLGWACTIANHIIVDKWRARGGLAAPVFVSTDEAAEALGLEDDDSEPTAESVLATEILERAFGQLLPRDQAVLELSRCGLDDETIGERLGIAGAHVRKVRYRALARLKDLLTAERDALSAATTAQRTGSRG
jgi:RNA polymerase sigma factor (sigma-70 family)